MQKLLRIVVILLLLMVVAAVIYTQSQIYIPAHHVILLPKSENEVQQPALHPQPVQAVSTPALAATAGLGSETSPVVVKMAGGALTNEELAEREKDRDIQRSIAHYDARIAATSLAQDFLMLFQAVIYFLTLLLLYLLMEKVKKFADAAAKSAEAARLCAELAADAVKKNL